MNPSFELGTPGEVPEGWYSGAWKTDPNPVYSVELTHDNALAGQGAGFVGNTEIVERMGLAPGNLAQRISNPALSGHRLRLRAAIRKEMPDDNYGVAKMWIGVEYSSGQPGEITDLAELPTRFYSTEWEYYTLTEDLGQDVAAVHVGVRVDGNALVWIDDVSLVDIGEPIMLAEPPRPLSDRGLENLTAFTRLLGYVRHFHASDEAANCDWDEFALRGVQAIEDAADSTELATQLEALFKPVAPTLQVFPTPDAEQVTQPDWWPGPAGAGLQAVHWQHRGCSQVTSAPSPYRSERIYQPAEDSSYVGTALDPRNPFRADLGGGVSCLLPLAVFADLSGTLPHAPVPPVDPTTGRFTYSGNDRASRLAGVALAWNVAQHFYVYFDVVETDWPGALRTALAAAATDPDEQAYLYTLRRMMVGLVDGHARVYHPRSEDQFQIPVVLGWAEGRLIITGIGEEGAGELQLGDIILSINGVPVADAVKQAEVVAAAATPQRKRFVVAKSLVKGTEKAEITLEVMPLGGAPRQATLHCTVPVDSLYNKFPEPICELRPGIWYVRLARGMETDFEPFLPQLAEAKGLIIDGRGCPGCGPDFLCHLTDTPMQSVHMIIPLFTEPDQHHANREDEGERWYLEPQSPRINAKLAFIIDAGTQSYHECIAEFIEAYHLGTLVGEPSSGSNGNVNPFIVAGDYTIHYTGMIVLKNNRSQHHATGILPDVLVGRTIEGTAEGRDEVLECAMTIVSE